MPPDTKRSQERVRTQAGTALWTVIGHWNSLIGRTNETSIPKWPPRAQRHSSTAELASTHRGQPRSGQREFCCFKLRGDLAQGAACSLGSQSTFPAKHQLDSSLTSNTYFAEFRERGGGLAEHTPLLRKLLSSGVSRHAPSRSKHCHRLPSILSQPCQHFTLILSLAHAWNYRSNVASLLNSRPPPTTSLLSHISQPARER